MILIIELFALLVIANSVWYLRKLIKINNDSCEKFEALKLGLDKDLQESKALNDDTVKMLEEIELKKGE